MPIVSSQIDESLVKRLDVVCQWLGQKRNHVLKVMIEEKVKEIEDAMNTIAVEPTIVSPIVSPIVQNFPLRPGTHLNSDKLPPPTEWCDVHQEAKIFDPDFGIQICQKCTA